MSAVALRVAVYEDGFIEVSSAVPVTGDEAAKILGEIAEGLREGTLRPGQPREQA